MTSDLSKVDLMEKKLRIKEEIKRQDEEDSWREREEGLRLRTCTPRIPKMMKKAQQIRTMFPMGFRDVIRVSTTSFRPGARLITLRKKYK